MWHADVRITRLRQIHSRGAVAHLINYSVEIISHTTNDIIATPVHNLPTDFFVGLLLDQNLIPMTAPTIGQRHVEATILHFNALDTTAQDVPHMAQKQAISRLSCSQFGHRMSGSSLIGCYE